MIARCPALQGELQQPAFARAVHTKLLEPCNQPGTASSGTKAVALGGVAAKPSRELKRGRKKAVCGLAGAGQNHQRSSAEGPPARERFRTRPGSCPLTQPQKRCAKHNVEARAQRLPFAAESEGGRGADATAAPPHRRAQETREKKPAALEAVRDDTMPPLESDSSCSPALTRSAKKGMFLEATVVYGDVERVLRIPCGDGKRARAATQTPRRLRGATWQPRRPPRLVRGPSSPRLRFEGRPRVSVQRTVRARVSRVGPRAGDSFQRGADVLLNISSKFRVRTPGPAQAARPSNGWR